MANRYSVCNSKKFVHYVQNFTISGNEILVSFDVVSLFISVFMDKAFGLIFELFSSDKSLSSRTFLEIPSITTSLKYVFLLLYFLTKALFSNNCSALL